MKKKAFALTELLVVVVIIGVLAAVVLPKFRQVVENRKVTEAEGIMTAVRNEQHARCLLDQKYTTQGSQLASMPTNQGKNFTYTLEATGMTAKPVKQGRDFTLQIGYADGKLCCKGSGCSSLSTDYPTCKPLPADSGCAAPVIGEEEPVVGEKELCDKPETKDVKCSAVSEYGDGWKGTVRYVLDKETCSYKEESNTCEQELECDESKKETERDCPQGCGKYPVKATCDTSTGEWVYEEDTSSCKEPETEERDCSEAEEGATGTQTRTQVCKDGQWTYDGVEWEGECESYCVKQAREICGIEQWNSKNKEACLAFNEQERVKAAASGKSHEFYWQWRGKTNEDGTAGCELYCGLKDRDPRGWGSSYTDWCAVPGLPSRRIANESERYRCMPFVPFDYNKALADQEQARLRNPYGQSSDLINYAMSYKLDERFDDDGCWVSSDCPVGWKENTGGTGRAGGSHYRACEPTCGHKPGPAKNVHVLRKALSFEGPTNVQGHYWLDTKVIAVVGGSQVFVGGCPVWRGATEVIENIPTHIGDCHKELFGSMDNANNRQKMCDSLCTGRFKEINSGMCFEDIPLNMNPEAVGMTIQSRYGGKQVSEIVSCDPSQLQEGDIPFFIQQGIAVFALQGNLRRVATTTAVECVKDSNCGYFNN